MTDERLKIWIGLLRWAVASVGLVIMTTIINAGFKDREIGITELQEYDKYVSIVTDNSKISEKRLLAQYFSHITPSEKLREGWESYYEAVDKEYKDLMAQRRQKQNQLFEMENKRDSASTPQIKELEKEIEKIDNELTPTFSSTSKDYSAAIAWERVGFEKLFSKELREAILAFENAEKSYNSFHQVYEIANFLKSRSASNNLHDEDFWNSIYEKLLSDYSWKMPIEAKSKLEELVL
ncbi:hypothetical protein [Echinicola salinicaeni]|uniref:hypothetical protein n=1 Tax=Echinicola salinicaeni TaxID=2762757 RepID=UPI0016471564|nr:hypothetical protein [Echinicola salinicaeni]